MHQDNLTEGSRDVAHGALPSHARVVVIGAGIIGSSVAYHLAKMGWKDVVLLERDRITSGTTWHAAGLMVTFGSTSETSTEIRKYTRSLYAQLEAETGQETGFSPIGLIDLAPDKNVLEVYLRLSHSEGCPRIGTAWHPIWSEPCPASQSARRLASKNSSAAPRVSRR